MVTNILTIFIGFYLALMAEFFTNTLLQYFLQKSARAKVDQSLKKFEQALMMAQLSNGEQPTVPKDAVN